MSFNSWHFAVFFPCVSVAYFILPQRFRWMLLLAGSYYFYMSWKPVYGLLLLTSTVVDYSVGLMMSKTTDPRRRKGYLVFSLVANLGLLFTFKYFNFFNEVLRAALGACGVSSPIPAWQVVLPIGISFYTFQALSYTIDVYRGVQTPERHLGIFALYVSFFPQLVAGPIERSRRLLPQFRQRHTFNYQRTRQGLRLILWGLFKKMAIADRLAAYVDQIYAVPQQYSAVLLLVATYFFAFQVYCDFSGYSDIAVGAARVMGFRLTQNFRQPYLARSIRTLWRRWHISLTTWFRDYLYVPLGGNHVARWRVGANILIVFVLCGLWHGANWTFLCFGAYHGLYMLCSVLTKRLRARGVRWLTLDRHPMAHHLLQVLITFHLIIIGYVFFRARSVSEAFQILHRIIRDFRWPERLLVPRWDPVDFWLGVALIAFVLFVDWFERRVGDGQVWLDAQPLGIRWGVSYLLIFSLFFLTTKTDAFLYFRF